MALESTRRSSGMKATPEWWTHNNSYYIDFITKFEPKGGSHYEFDIVILWFYVLDIVADEQWVVDKNSEEQVIPFVGQEF